MMFEPSSVIVAFFFIYALFGLIIGSFLNVVILRHGARTVGGRSGCLSCGAPLVWYDMIPVASWLALRGRCRSCGSSISIQYPLVEATMAILFGLIGITPLSIPLKVASLVIVALLILIATYDIRHTIIPDAWAYGFAFLAFISSSSFALMQGGAAALLVLLIAGPLVALPLLALWAVSGGRWMGFGDVKLSLGIGWLLGLQSGLAAIFLAFVIGAVVSLCVLIPLEYLKSRMRRGILMNRSNGADRSTVRRLTMKSEVPFGPFLVAACIIVWLATIYGIPLPFLSFL